MCLASRKSCCPLQDALDLIEFVTGPADSEWGSLRAKMGRSQPWELNYFAIGNEVIDLTCCNLHLCTHATLPYPALTVSLQWSTITCVCHSGSHWQGLLPVFANCFVASSVVADFHMRTMVGQRHLWFCHVLCCIYLHAEQNNNGYHSPVLLWWST